MTHAEMDQLYELYSLGVLDFTEAVEIDSHLADGCEYCLRHVEEAVTFTAGLSGLAEIASPPENLRERILASVQTKKLTARSRPWIAACALLALTCAILVVVSVWSVREIRQTRVDLTRILQQRNQLRSALQILTEQQTTSVRFGQSASSAHGWLFVNRETGFVFVGSDLPPLASDKTFELWLVPPKGRPAPAGLFRPDSRGQFVLISGTLIRPATYAAVAVSVEPHAGSPQPTTKPFLIVPLAE
jgi:anti-sigma-K factor RskA